MRLRPIREPRRVERRPQEVAGAVAREHATCPVAAVSRRGEAHDQDGGVRVAEPGQRPSPVRLVCEPGHLLAHHALAPRDEARACTALDDLGSQGGQSGLP